MGTTPVSVVPIGDASMSATPVRAAYAYRWPAYGHRPCRRTLWLMVMEVATLIVVEIRMDEDKFHLEYQTRQSNYSSADLTVEDLSDEELVLTATPTVIERDERRRGIVEAEEKMLIFRQRCNGGDRLGAFRASTGVVVLLLIGVGVAVVKLKDFGGVAGASTSSQSIGNCLQSSTSLKYRGAGLGDQTKRTRAQEERALTARGPKARRGGPMTTTDEADVALFLLHFERRRWQPSSSVMELRLESEDTAMREERHGEAANANPDCGLTVAVELESLEEWCGEGKEEAENVGAA
ncbi:hypothetical protein BHM03_00040377 [Ensete ventricosum]|nr:hypothetical protein BHM03_00040377 [Ensete ventricosum]